jgi:carbamoylphosphate synthase small subunit
MVHKKSEITTATATVKAKDFNQGVVRDASELIKGKIAGLSISNGSGDPLMVLQFLRGLLRFKEVQHH